MDAEYKFKNHSRMAFIMDAMRRKKSKGRLSGTMIFFIIWLIIVCGVIAMSFIDPNRYANPTATDWLWVFAILIVILLARYLIWIPILLYMTKGYPKNLEWSVARAANGLFFISNRGGRVFVNSATHRIVKYKDKWIVENDQLPFAQFMIPCDAKSDELMQCSIIGKGPPPLLSVPPK